MINLNMAIILSCGMISLLLFECQANDLFLQKPEAVRFLSRFRRANHFAEEFKAGNLERECLEETCSKEEVREIFEDDVQTNLFWDFYTGRTRCDPSPCKNNGICVDDYGEISCNCSGGFNGTFCELGRTRCDPSPCKNNGTCVDEYGEISCNCSGGFNGTFCELDINECELMHLCPPGTTCVDGINKFTCLCPVDGCNGITLNIGLLGLDKD